MTVSESSAFIKSMTSKFEIQDEGGDNLSQAQSEYIELLEEKLMDQANEILYLKRKLNGIGGNDA